MKAALEAWGANSNLFHQGQRSKPMIPPSSRRPWPSRALLKRPVGTAGTFSEHAALPKFPISEMSREPAAVKSRGPKPPPFDDTMAREAAGQFAKEHKQRNAEQQREAILQLAVMATQASRSSCD
jgi:hypothetical protein